MSVRKWMFAGALLLAAGLSSLGFAQKPGLKFNPDKKFKIVQFTDLHVKWQDPRSDIAFERMNQVLDDEKPDLVIFTGDIIYSKPALENMRNVLKTVSDRKIPFSIVFGNHDNEQGATKEELLKVAESLPYSLTADEVPEISGVGNYALTVRSSDGKKDACVLYCIDSNTYSTIKGVKGYDYIKRDQIDWYCKKSAEFTRNNGGEPVPSLAFFQTLLGYAFFAFFTHLYFFNGFAKFFNIHYRYSFLYFSSRSLRPFCSLIFTADSDFPIMSAMALTPNPST